MEKYVIFGPMVIFLGFFVLLVVGFLLLVGKLFMKGKNQSWIGEVIDKSTVTKEKDGGFGKETFLSLKVQLENGEVHSIPATREFFNEIKIGDKLKKDKGALWPKKI